MDDFLHNLRSGKLKQPDRGRSHADYKGPQRRVSNERRRTDYYAKVTGDHFALVKDAIESLAEQQKRIAEALTANENAQIRIADALEAIVARLGGEGDEKGGQTRRTADGCRCFLHSVRARIRSRVGSIRNEADR